MNKNVCCRFADKVQGVFACNLKIMLALLVLFPLLSAHGKAYEGEGKAEVLSGDYATARHQAYESALKDAIDKASLNMMDYQQLRNGADEIEPFDRQGMDIRNVSVTEEEEVNGYLLLTVQADIRKKMQCEAGTGNGYKKSTLLAAFALQNPASASVGRAENIERALPAYLSGALSESGSVVVYQSSQYQLYPELINAPTSETDKRTLTRAVSIAKDLGVQFVVSGVVRDMSMHDPDALDNSWLSRVGRLVRLKDRTRTFSIEVFVHDGVSGALVFQKPYRVDAQWNLDVNEQAAFGSPNFWSSDYGMAVGRLLDDVSWDVSEALRCQPFIARISKANGKTLHIKAGANSEIKPGDKLSVYRTFSFYDADQLQYVELTDAKATLVVDQVQPQFSRGNLMIDAGRLNVQEDDLLIAW